MSKAKLPSLLSIETRDRLAGHLNHLTPAQVTALDEFRTKLAADDFYTPAIDSEEASHDESTLLSSMNAKRSHLQQISTLANKNYAETLGTIFVVGAPGFLSVVWGWVGKWFDPGTVEKIFILRDDEVFSTLNRFIESADIPQSYGGQLPWAFGDRNGPNLDEAEKTTLQLDGCPPGSIRWIRGEVVIKGTGRTPEELIKVTPQREKISAPIILSLCALIVENAVVKVPSNTDLVLLSPLGCGLATGAGAVINLLKPSPKSSIAIFGIGAVGTGAIFAAAYLGLTNIIVVDVVPERLELAKTLGATHAINGRDSDIVEQIKKLTAFGAGTTYAIEATGNPQVFKNAYVALANRGHLVSCGSPGPGHVIPIEIHDSVLASKTYTGLTEGDSNPVKFIPFLINLYKEGKFPVDKISKIFPMQNFDDAVHAMHSGEVIKPIIIFD
ncbi:hypothetical protein P7C70_g7652, partial [Phenoliferia sp. Uapishka_3]